MKPSQKVFTYDMPHSPDSQWAKALSQAKALNQFIVQGSKLENEMDYFESVIEKFDEPIGDSIILPTDDLLKSVRQQVAVTLSGEGADEIFGGYAHQQALLILTKLFRWFSLMAANVVSAIPLGILNKLHQYPKKFDRQIKSRLKSVLKSKVHFEKHLILSQVFDQNELQKFMNVPAVDLRLIYKRKWNSIDSGFSDFQKIKIFDINNWLVQYNLNRIDTLSRSMGLEVRVPYLDHHFVETVFDQARHRLWDNLNKNLLRQMADENLPKEFQNRKKFPFFSPNETQLASIKIRSLQLIEEMSTQLNFLNLKQLKTFLLDDDSDFLYSKKITCLFIFLIWYRKWFATSSPA